MNRAQRTITKRSLPAATTVFAVVVGLVAGVLVLTLSALETKWVVYAVGGIGFMSLLMMISNKPKFLWIVFILGFQVNVALRFLYGYSESTGIEVQFCVLLGVLFFCSQWLSDHGLSDHAQRRPLRLFGAAAPALLFMAALFVVASLASGERFIAMASMIVYAQYYFLFFLGLNYLADEERSQLTVTLLLVTLLIQSLIYYLQSLLGVTFTLTGEVLAETALPRPGGTVATTPASFASFIFPLLMISIACTLLDSLPRKVRVLAGIVAAAGSLALILTFTRAAWAGYVLALIWLTGFAVYYKLMRWRLLMVLATVALVVGSIAVPFILGSRADNPLSSAFDERFALMQMAINVIKANLLTGVGPGSYPFVYKFYLTPDLADNWLFIVHNTYLLMAAELGVGGAVALIMWLLTGIILGLSVARHEASPLLRAMGLGSSAGFVALAWEMYWEPLNGLYGMSQLLPYWLLLGFLAARYQPKPRQQPPRRQARARRLAS